MRKKKLTRKVWFTGIYLGEKSESQIKILKKQLENSNTLFFVDGETDFMVCDYD